MKIQYRLARAACLLLSASSVQAYAQQVAEPQTPIARPAPVQQSIAPQAAMQGLKTGNQEDKGMQCMAGGKDGAKGGCGGMACCQPCCCKDKMK